ncbi:hypothetical protein [Streptomyces parvulus]|uniref:hypothetical protein n=1 Tax=Streptomyces parvulus TaxID=146923 RepID=UPI0033A24D8A
MGVVLGGCGWFGGGGMSDSILVRVTLDSYDVVHPSEKQTQVYVQIPEVGRASWLLDSSFYGRLKNEPWPHVIDEAHSDYMRRGVVSDSASAAARQAIVDWLLLSEGAECDARFDAVQEAWELDQARQHPVARKLLARVTELEKQLAECSQPVSEAELDVAVEELSAELRMRLALASAQRGRRELRARVAELEAQREALAARLRAGQRWKWGRTPPLVSQDYVSQDELRAIFGIELTAPWDEDPVRPCGCPRRFDRHADGCATAAAEAGESS